MRVFENPHCLTQALCHGFVGPMTIPLHRHSDLLQLDFNYGYSGYVRIGKERIEIQNITALAIYPGEPHEIMLTPHQADAKVFSLKIKVDRHWPAIRSRFFARVSHRAIADYLLLKSLGKLVRLAMVPTSRPSVQCAALAEVLCYWPTPQTEQDHCEIWNSEEEIGKGMNAVLSVIDQRLKNPPTLEELATIAFMSPRNFVRRFRALFSCAPHQYMTARRVQWARELLLEKNATITEIAERMGFPSIHTFSRWFHRETGISPSIYRQKSQVL